MNRKNFETILIIVGLFVVYAASEWMKPTEVMIMAYVLLLIIAFFAKDGPITITFAILAALLPLVELVSLAFLHPWPEVQKVALFYGFAKWGGYLLLCLGIPWAVVRISKSHEIFSRTKIVK